MYEPTPIAIIAKNIKGCCVKKVKILVMKLIAIIANPPKIRYQPICFLLVFTSKNNMLKISKSSNNKVFSRHQAPKVFEIIANIYCLRGEYLKKAKHLFSGNIIGHEIEQNKAFDVDSKYDLEIMKMFFKKLKKND